MSSVEATPDAGAPLAGLAIYTMFRGETSQLLQWCNVHLNAGADHLYVVLDRPEAGLLDALPSDPRLTWQPVTAETWSASYADGGHHVERRQVDAFRWMSRRAEREGHTHLAFVDADELIHLAEPFTTLLGRFPDAGSLTVPVREMWFAPGDSVDEPFSASLGLRRSVNAGTTLADAFGWRAQFLRNGVMGHDVGKTIHRLPLAAGDITVHRPRTAAGRAANVSLPPESGTILHYDAGSVAAWNAKWAARADGSTLAAGLFPHRRVQQQFFAHALRAPDDAQREFFTGFYTLDQRAQEILGSAGVLERVDVSAEISTPLAVPASQVTGSMRRLPAAARRVDFQFALACDRRFVRPSFATMTSVVAQIGHRGSIRFVVLGDGLGHEDVAHLKELERTPYDVSVVVHDITADLDRDIGTEDPKRTTFGRIYLVDYLPEQRTVYLDGDVLATRDFTELFTMDLGGACFAGVSDSAALRLVAEPGGVPLPQRNRLMGITNGEPLDYLNGGVLIFDLDHPQFRRLALEARGMVMRYGRALIQRDQDAMNLAFTGYKHRLPHTYNYMTQFYVSDRAVDGELPQLKYAAADATFVHFSGRIKPWEAPDEEYYNGLYRRMVIEAEEKVGVSCDFYFSRPHELRRDWDPALWVETLTTHPQPTETGADLELVDIAPATLYLRVSAPMRSHIAATGLRLVGVAGGDVVLDAALDGLGSPSLRLGTNGVPGVRRLPVDVSAIRRLSAEDAAGVELFALPPDASPEEGFARSIGVVDLRSWTGRSSGAAPTGSLESLVAGVLRGWVDATGPAEPVSLWLDDELVAQTTRWFERSEQGARGRGFEFDLRAALGAGVAPTSAISVRLAGRATALPGTPLDVEVALRKRRRGRVYDAAADAWVRKPFLNRTPRELARGVGNRARRMIRPPG